MHAKLLYFWELLKSSFWLVPLLLIVLGIFAAGIFIFIDSQETVRSIGMWSFLLIGGSESAKSVLTLVAGAMLGMASTVFSITLVALTLASSQFGPRLLRNFMYDRINQVVLGTYLATFVYCLMVLKTVSSVEGAGFVPHYSILFALLLAIGNIILLIVFIHHISIGIQADQVISDISNKLNASVKKLFPKELGNEPDDKDGIRFFKHTMAGLPVRGDVLSPATGYIQAIDGGSLMTFATENKLLLEILHRPGSFLVEGQPLLRYAASPGRYEDLVGTLQKAFVLGSVRTPTQDPEFAVHQVVEIACRALSPGINDPYTAIACIDTLTATLCYLAKASFPSPVRFDENGEPRIYAIPTTFEGVMGAAFNQIRSYARTSPFVLLRLMGGLATIHGFAQSRKVSEIVQDHAQMVLRSAEGTTMEKCDLERVREAYKNVVTVQNEEKR